MGTRTAVVGDGGTRWPAPEDYRTYRNCAQIVRLTRVGSAWEIANPPASTLVKCFAHERLPSGRPMWFCFQPGTRHRVIDVNNSIQQMIHEGQ